MSFFIGLLLGALILVGVVLLYRRGVRPAWYAWLPGVLGLALLFFATQNYLAARADHEPTAPGVFLLVFGLPGLLLLFLAAGTVCLGIWRKRKVIA